MKYSVYISLNLILMINESETKLNLGLHCAIFTYNESEHAKFVTNSHCVTAFHTGGAQNVGAHTVRSRNT